MDKVSIYDFIVFFVPGATFLLLGLWWLQALNTPLFYTGQYPQGLLAIVAVLPCYFAGNFLSWLGTIIETRVTAAQKPTGVELLENDSWLADRLNETAQAKWNFSFKTNGVIDKDLSDRFYNLAYQMLEVEGKLDKVRTLFTQYRLFCSSVPLAVAAFVMALVIIVKNCFALYSCNCACCMLPVPEQLAEAVAIALTSVVFCLLAQYFYPKRRKLMIKALFEMFYAYTVINK